MQVLQTGSVLIGLILVSLGLFNGNTMPYGNDTKTFHTLNIPTPPDGGVEVEATMPTYLNKGLNWLVTAQFDNGGWGAGQHSAQGIRDPHAVKIDPATTALAAMALIRTGNTLSKGEHQENLQKALEYLLEAVEASPDEGSQITDVTGTQPQRKLGQHIDVSMCAQFFGKILRYAEGDEELTARIEKALDKCVSKLEGAQQTDGSWNTGGWAPVLQSAMANTALEQAKMVGREVDDMALTRSKEYQRGNIDVESGNVRAEEGAGIALYAVAANKVANASDAKKARDAARRIADSIRSVSSTENEAELGEEDLVTVENFTSLGYDQDMAEGLVSAYKQDKITQESLKDDRVIAGFGNNGGEEFLSFMMTSESLALDGEEAWTDWYDKMNDLFGNIQNDDGSWSGHHCITSPVFCTAAVIMTMTADRDPEINQANLD